MRSDRDIKRIPRRPLAGTPAGEPDAAGKPGKPGEAPVERKAVPSTAALKPAKPGAQPARPAVHAVAGGSPPRPPAPRPAASRPGESRAADPRSNKARADRPDRPEWADRPARPDRPDRPPRQGAPAAPYPRPPSPNRPSPSGAAPRRPEAPAPRPPRPAGPTRVTPVTSQAASPHEKRWFGPETAARNPDEGIRLSKVLSDRGLASRREADDWIDAGWVKVDGEMAVLGQRVKPDQRIEVDPVAHMEQAKRVTILINKPIGYVSGQAEDGYEPASVLVTLANHWDEDPARKAFHAGHARHLAPAGRLDIDSTGLLVLTQDGRVAKHLIGENSEVEKEYLVRVEPLREGSFDPDSGLRLLQHGLVLDEKELRPARVSWANEDQLRFVLREGRKRQIRRMCELVGLNVTGLKRVRIGSVVLGKLPPGQWRYLREDERF